MAMKCSLLDTDYIEISLGRQPDRHTNFFGEKIRLSLALSRAVGGACSMLECMQAVSCFDL